MEDFKMVNNIPSGAIEIGTKYIYLVTGGTRKDKESIYTKIDNFSNEEFIYEYYEDDVMIDESVFNLLLNENMIENKYGVHIFEFDKKIYSRVYEVGIKNTLTYEGIFNV